MTKIKNIKLGTRQSPLAMFQAQLVKDLLEKQHPGLSVDLVAIKTTGDIILDKRLCDIGGKALFTKELDNALYDGRCDIAVHSLKDVETILPEGMELSCTLPREDIQDVIISRDNIKLLDLPQGATIGTTSLRRQAQLLKMRPDFNIIMFRGNVGTRLKKLKQGDADATLLALAGLNRLGMQHVATEVLDSDVFIPAVGQGAITIQCLSTAMEIKQLVAPLHCEDTHLCVSCERAMLYALDGTCKTPVGGKAVLDGLGNIKLTAFASTHDASVFKLLEKTAPIAQAQKLGRDVGSELRAYMGIHFDRM